MTPPVYEDNSSIEGRERLFRRIHPVHHMCFDESLQQWRVNSAAFKDPQLSVDIESELIKEGMDPQDCLAQYASFYLVSITAGDARTHEQSVCRDPVPEDHAHGIVYGNKERRRIYEKLRMASVWVIPTEPPLGDTP